MDLPEDNLTASQDDDNLQQSKKSQDHSDLIQSKAALSDTGQNGSEEEMAATKVLSEDFEAQDNRVQQLLDNLAEGFENTINNQSDSGLDPKPSESVTKDLSERGAEEHSSSQDAAVSSLETAVEHVVGGDSDYNSSMADATASRIEDKSSSQSHAHEKAVQSNTHPEMSGNKQSVTESELSQDSHMKATSEQSSKTMGEPVDSVEEGQEHVHENNTMQTDDASKGGEVENVREGDKHALRDEYVSLSVGENASQEITVMNERTDLNAESRDKDSESVESVNQSVSSNKTLEVSVKDSKQGEKQNDDDDDDDDIVVVSETPRDKNKKVSLATIFKCQRCGHSTNSRAELNKHLLEAHKLIIVSKQKSVDCLFCSLKLDMKDFHQHLKSEHKVLLVRSQNKSKSDESATGDTASAPSSSTKQDSTPSTQLIDLTCDDEDVTKSASPSKVSAITAKEIPNKTSNVSKVNAGKAEEKPKETSNVGKTELSISSSVKSAEKPVELPLPLRRTPRKIKVRSYAEEEASLSSDENEDLDTFVDNEEDEDYNPSHENDGKSKQKSPLRDGLPPKQPVAVKLNVINPAGNSSGSSNRSISLSSGNVGATTSAALSTNINNSLISQMTLHSGGLASTPKTVSLAPTSRNVTVAQTVPSTPAAITHLGKSQIKPASAVQWSVLHCIRKCECQIPCPSK